MTHTHSVIRQPLKISLLTLIGSLLIVNNANAEGTVVGKFGSIGGGLEYVHPISSKFAIGVGINGFSLSETLEESDIDYDADLKMQNITVIGDYHPFANGFRLSAGVVHNGNEFSLDAKPTSSGTLEVNGNSYDTSSTIESLNGSISFKSIAPYVGLGWGHAPKSGKGWSFDADLGILFQGAPEASLSVNCISTVAGVCNTVESDVAAEEESFITDTEDFDVYPVITIGASYTF